MIVVIKPPIVSTPKDKGVTSNNIKSVISPAIIPACTDAPIATTSSGFTVSFKVFPKKSDNKLRTAGILVDPPTKIT